MTFYGKAAFVIFLTFDRHTLMSFYFAAEHFMASLHQYFTFLVL